jgi:hypothetical protein
MGRGATCPPLPHAGEVQHVPTTCDVPPTSMLSLRNVFHLVNRWKVKEILAHKAGIFLFAFFLHLLRAESVFLKMAAEWSLCIYYCISTH